MRVLSLNVNGIKHCCTQQPSIKQFFTNSSVSHSDSITLHSFLKAQQADVVFLQELKTSEKDASKCLSQFSHIYPHIAIHASTKKGYSGVAILSKHKPTAVTHDLTLLTDTGCSTDEYCVKSYADAGLNKEGRILAVQVDNVMLINIYTVNSGKEAARKSERQCFEFGLARLVHHVQHVMQCQVVIGGDFNVCPSLTKLDCSNPNWFSRIPGGFDYELDSLHELCKSQDLKDAYRALHPKGNKFTNKCGKHTWRLDMFLTSSGINVKACEVYEDVEISDHRPITIEW
jgi:exodeoxyribonuclease III